MNRYRLCWQIRLLASAALLACAGSALADRNILTPTGLIAKPSSAKLEYLDTFRGSRNYLGFATFGLPGDDVGIEIEAEQVHTPGRTRNTLHAQYSLTGNALVDIAPVISVGVRDILGNGREGIAPFVAATKQFGLSVRQERLLRELKVTAGIGARRMEGAFFGVQAKLPFNIVASGEYMARRFNASAGIAVNKNLRLTAYTLDGSMFYGASFSISK